MSLEWGVETDPGPPPVPLAAIEFTESSKEIWKARLNEAECERGLPADEEVDDEPPAPVPGPVRAAKLLEEVVFGCFVRSLF